MALTGQAVRDDEDGGRRESCRRFVDRPGGNSPIDGGQRRRRCLGFVEIAQGPTQDR